VEGNVPCVRVSLEVRGTMRAHFYVNADDRLMQIADGVKAGVAEIQRKLVFTAGAETAVTFVAGGKIGMLLLPDLNFRMNFECSHEDSPVKEWASVLPEMSPPYS
jgi:hypothetical protein